MNFNFVDSNFSYCTEILKSNESHFYTYGKSSEMKKYSNRDLESHKNLMTYFEYPIIYCHFDSQNEMEIYLDLIRQSPSSVPKNFRDVIALGNMTCRELTDEEKVELINEWNEEETI